jgi:hypothetical protein
MVYYLGLSNKCFADATIRPPYNLTVFVFVIWTAKLESKKKKKKEKEKEKRTDFTDLVFLLFVSRQKVAQFTFARENSPQSKGIFIGRVSVIIPRTRHQKPNQF